MSRISLALVLFHTTFAHAAWPSLERIVESTFDTAFTPAREERAKAYSRMHGHSLPMGEGRTTWESYHPEIRFQLARQETYDHLIAQRVHEMWTREPGRSSHLTSWQMNEIDRVVAMLVGDSKSKLGRELHYRLREIGRNVPELDEAQFAGEMALHGEMLARTIERIAESEDPAVTKERVIDALKIITHAQLLTGARGPQLLDSLKSFLSGHSTENLSRNLFWVNARRAIREIRRGEMMTEYDENSFRLDAVAQDSDDPDVTARRVLNKLAEWVGESDLKNTCETVLATTPPPMIW